MRQPINYLLLLVVILIYVLTNSCERDYLIPEETQIPDTVKFSADIIPILDNDCSVNNCHDRNGIPPELSPDKAYINLNVYGLIDEFDPENSGLYLRLISDKDFMPPDGKLPDSKIELILKWIKQGALNN